MSMTTVSEIAKMIPNATLRGTGFAEIMRITTDTRSLAMGDLFVALKGERFDANLLLAEALARGAVAAICVPGASPTVSSDALPRIEVNDPKKALGELGSAWRARFDLSLIAVTGSNGKTTVTQMIAAILQAWKPRANLATRGNFNNDIGVPLTLSRLTAQHEVAVVELGMNHPGEIASLARMAQPTVALVNNAQREHMEFMSSVEAVAQENGSVFKYLPLQGIAVFPSDDDFSDLWRELAVRREVWTFSLEPSNRVDLSRQVYCSEFTWAKDVWQVVAQTPAGPLKYSLHIAGTHNVKNSLAAIACSLAAGVPLKAVARGLESFQPVKGRSRVFGLAHPAGTCTVIDDTYNANPDSVRAAIDMLAELPGPHLLVLGDMGEVGDQGAAFHAEVGAYARERSIDFLFTLGVQAEFASQGFGTKQHFADVNALNAAVAVLWPQCGSVLVKGSRFMKMERVIEAVENNASSKNEEQAHAQ